MKAQNGFWNLVISREKMEQFVRTSDDWYELDAVRGVYDNFDTFEKLGRIEKMLETLLGLYMQKFYKRHQGVFEDKHLTTVAIKEKDFPTEESRIYKNYLTRF